MNEPQRKKGPKEREFDAHVAGCAKCVRGPCPKAMKLLDHAAEEQTDAMLSAAREGLNR